MDFEGSIVYTDDAAGFLKPGGVDDTVGFFQQALCILAKYFVYRFTADDRLPRWRIL